MGDVRRALLVAFLIFVIGGVLRPVLVVIAAALGWVGAVLIGLFGQTAVIWVVLAHLARGGGAALGHLHGLLGRGGRVDPVRLGGDRRHRRRRHRQPAPRRAAQAAGRRCRTRTCPGSCSSRPTGCRSRSWTGACAPAPCRPCPGGSAAGSHRMAEWRPKLPATTPASQMGILHGTIEGIPAFRWVDRAEGRVYVANKPADAAAIEARHSDGRGLLADDGVSVSNLFTGDAPTAYATMSAVHRTQETREARLDTVAGSWPAPAAWPAACRGLSARSPASASRPRGPGGATSGRGCTAAGGSPASVRR